MVILGLGANDGLGAKTGLVIEAVVRRVLIREAAHGISGKEDMVLLTGKDSGGIESIRNALEVLCVQRSAVSRSQSRPDLFQDPTMMCLPRPGPGRLRSRCSQQRYTIELDCMWIWARTSTKQLQTYFRI